uniref:Uncharacterized protein n=1 Tax=Arundo donax TaxID=35708 RepID=A0A0A9DI00_ARUDO
MTSSPSPRPAVWLRPPPPSPVTSFAYFSAVSLRGILSLSSASRVPSISIRRQRPLDSPFAGRPRLLNAARSSGDPGEMMSAAFTQF